MWSETISVLHRAVWRGAASERLAIETLDRILAAPVRRGWHRRLHREAWEIATALGWAKTYDAEYVALARLARLPLLTLDARLRRGAARLVEVLAPTELPG